MTNEEIELLGRIHGMTVAQDSIGFARDLLSRAIPEGHVVVPNEPTTNMGVAGYRAYRDSVYQGEWIKGIYRAMISAAPAPEGEA